VTEEPKEIDGASLSDMVYQLAPERIDALVGCTEGSPEEQELILWAEITDRHEQAAGILETGLHDTHSFRPIFGRAWASVIAAPG